MRSIGVAALGCLAVALFFRVQILTGFDTLFGDRYDGAIETAILEHWNNVFHGISPWSRTLFFYPAPGTLGYNDGYFLYGIAYSVLRAAGLDPYLASEGVNVAMKLVGFAAFHLFARRAIGVPRWAAAAGACVFTLSNNSYMASRHVQLFAIGLAPALATLLHGMAGAAGRRDRRAVLAWGACAAGLFSAWLLTSYYMAWFTALFAAVLLPALAVTGGGARCRAALLAGRDCLAPLLAVAAMFALGLVPFLALYLPKAVETGMHDFPTVWSYLVTPRDLLNLGYGSLLYGRLGIWLQPDSFRHPEQITGFTPGLLLLFGAAGLAAWRTPNDDRRWPVRALFVSALITWALALRVDGHSLWTVVYTVVPGARAARVVARIQIFLTWPVVAVATAGLGWLHAWLRRRPALAILAPTLIAGACALEQINDWNGLQLDRPSELAWLRAVPPPAAGCRAFFVSAPRPPDTPGNRATAGLIGHNIDAMMVAERFHIPTINGYASFEPPGWDLLSIDRPDYLRRVRDNAVANHLVAGLCGLDLADDRWSTSPLAGF